MGSSINISEYGGDCQFCGKATTHDEQFHDYFPDVPMVASVEGTNGVICSVCAEDSEGSAGSFRDGTGCISKGSFPGLTCEYCGFDPHELVYYQCKQNDEDLTWDDWKEELEFYFYEGSHSEQCQGLIDENKKAESGVEPPKKWLTKIIEEDDSDYEVDDYLLLIGGKIREVSGNTEMDVLEKEKPDSYHIIKITGVEPYKIETVDFNAESFNAPTGYTERGPRPFYGNPRKMALDRWGNRRFIRRRKDGTYMKNVDVGRSLAMDRRRQSQTWAPAGYRDQGDGSPSLLVRLLDMFKGVDEEVLMAESYLMCAGCDDYSSECGCHNSESDAYIYAYNDGHTDARNQSGYKPTTSEREITSFKKIFKQAEEYWFEEYNDLAIPKNPTKMEEFMLDSFSAYDYYNPEPNDTLVQGLAIADDSNFLKIYDVVAKQDGIIDSSHPAEALIIAIKVWNALYQ